MQFYASFTNENVPKGQILEMLSGLAHFWEQICPQNMAKAHTHTQYNFFFFHKHFIFLIDSVCFTFNISRNAH